MPVRFLFLLLNSPFTTLIFAFALFFINNKKLLLKTKIKITLSISIFYLIVLTSSILNEKLYTLMRGVCNPLNPSLILLLIPSLILRKSRYYKAFLTFPVAIILLAIFATINEYLNIPFEERIFAWIIIHPTLLFAAFFSFFILLEPILDLNSFRYAVRAGAFVVLIFGGFMFRKNFTDYKEMLARRKTANPGVMMISETTPVLYPDENSSYSYLPSAPCRFAPDGGYVQGCNMEMFQRFMQMNYKKLANNDIVEMKIVAKLLGALISFLSLSLLAGRWFCGWICPLSTIGDIIDRIRRLFKLPHLKASQPVKIAYFFSGLNLGFFGLVLAKLYPHIDENGKFMGCKIPIFPLCKICPAQQICPVIAGGISNYPPIPGWEWVFGFYRLFTAAILVFFLASFALSRRIWCYFCPMGMISGIFNRGGLAELKKEPIKCNSCGVCYEVCPMQIDTVRAEMKNTNVSSYDCILCLKCVEKCPQNKCLHFEFAGKKVVESKF
ncbi:MAG TPA: 4Fe-4S binding protein [Victivallales bacterium]|nr:4Fe-4S binding protein [Victivallales bacterium]